MHCRAARHSLPESLLRPNYWASSALSARQQHTSYSWPSYEHPLGSLVQRRAFTLSPKCRRYPDDVESPAGKFMAQNLDARRRSRSDALDRPHGPREVIHILGVGNLAVFLAHSLAGLAQRPPITLLYSDHRVHGAWALAQRVLKVTTHGLTDSRSGFDLEFLSKKVYKRSQVDPNDFSSWLDRSQPGSLDAETFSNTDNGKDLDLEADSEEAAGQEIGEISEVPTEIEGDIVRRDKELGRDQVFNLQGQQITNPIYNLIITVKSASVIRTLMHVRGRLTPESTICFLQKGMGTADQVSERVFPDERQRPHYIVGASSHALWGEQPFAVNYGDRGSLSLSYMPAGPPEWLPSYENSILIPQTARYLLRTLTRTPVLIATGYKPSDLFQMQLDDIAIAAVIEPLTAIFDCLDHQLRDNLHVKRIMRLLIAEISVVIRSLPELQHLPNVNMRYDAAHIESRLYGILQNSPQRASLTLRDVQHGRVTEISHINGYIVHRGEALGVHCVTNYMVMQQVLAMKRFFDEKQLGMSPPLPKRIQYDGNGNEY